EGAIDLLKELKNITMSLDTLQSTRIGMSVNAVRKQSTDEEVQTIAKSLIKSWKKLVDSSENKADEKKKESSSPSSSSKNSPQSGDQSSSKKQEAPKTPSTPTTPKVTTFPAVPVTIDSVRNKCRELLVAALQMDTSKQYVSPFVVHCLEMASAELKEVRKALTKESIREHQLAKTGGTETDLFQCGKCSKKNCTYTQIQYRYTNYQGDLPTQLSSLDTGNKKC
ncbi:Transcription elongation factor A protein 2, partial [Acipenser ruthenus]